MKLKSIATAGLIFFATQASAQSATWIAGGSHEGSASFSIGARGDRFGLEVGALFNGDMSDSEVLDYPVPHNSYRNLGEKRIGSTYGIDLLAFHNFNKTISVYAGVGGYFSDRRDIAQSTVTGWYYTQKDKSSFEGAFSAGLQLFPTEKLMLGVGYHTIRGANLQIGISF